jgi:transcriptional regulator with XRE-family HTH domain
VASAQQQRPARPAEKIRINIVGPRIRKLRVERGWSQSQFATQLQLKGLDIGRDVVARIECQIHAVRDRDIPFFARTLGVEVCSLFLCSTDGISNNHRHVCPNNIFKKL